MTQIDSPRSYGRLIFYCLAGYALLFSWSVPLANAVIDTGLAIALIGMLRSRRFPALEWRIPAAVLAFIFLAAISGLLSPSPAKSLRPLWHLFYYMLTLPLALATIKTGRQKTVLFRCVCISLLVSSCYIFWQGYQGFPRAWGMTGTWLIAATYLELSIPLLFVLVLEGKFAPTVWRWACPALLVICGFALILVNSRASWIAVGITIVVYFFCRLRQLSRKKLLLVSVSVCLCLSMFVVNPFLLSRLQSITDTNYNNNAERIRMWQSAWHMFRDHPVLGVGLGNYPDLYHSKYILPTAVEPDQTHPHSNYLIYLAETGLIGFSAFIAMFLYLLRHYWSRFRNGQDPVALGMFLSIVSFMVHGGMDWNYGMFPSTSQYLWFLVGATWQDQ